MPNGTRIFGAGGLEILPISGFYTLQPEDVNAFVLEPPLHYSSAVQGDIVLNTTTIVTDDTDTTQIDLQISIALRGVADKPPTQNILVESLEDEMYDLGTPLQGQLGGVLIDVSRIIRTASFQKGGKQWSSPFPSNSHSHSLFHLDRRFGNS